MSSVQGNSTPTIMMLIYVILACIYCMNCQKATGIIKREDAPKLKSTVAWLPKGPQNGQSVSRFARHDLCRHTNGQAYFYNVLKTKICDMNDMFIEYFVYELCNKKGRLLEMWTGALFDLDTNGFVSDLEKNFYNNLNVSGCSQGRAVAVYDGRTWPVVKCGAVYVTDNDKTKTVTKNVVALSSSDDRKIKTSKYTLAIGSSFGHVHGFLKDTDPVLKTLDKYKVEDKCLLLIKKPKSASKQMLKAHSWANLNVSDMSQRNPDGSVKNDLYRTFKGKGPVKARTSDLSLSLPDPKSRSVSESATCDTNSLSDLDLTRSSELPQKQNNKKKDLNVPNVYSSYPVNSNDHRSDSENSGINELEKKMGQGYSTTVEGQVQLTPQSANRPTSLPPSVPSSNKSHNDKKKSNPNLRNSHSEADKSKNRNLNRSKSDSEENMLYIHTKHDSGFYSDTRLSKEEMYDYGFKPELETNSGNMTSSPRSKGGTPSSEKSVSKNNKSHVIKEKSSSMKPEGQTCNNFQGQRHKATKGPVYPQYAIHGSVENLLKKENLPLHSSSVINVDNKENVHMYYGSKLNLHQQNGNTEQPKQNMSNKLSPSSSVHSDQETSCKRKPATDAKESIKISIENGEPVLRTKSLGDLQTGCAFSLVGQRKSENYPISETDEFTGSKMTAYYRKIREMKKESKGGSLPFRGRNVDVEAMAKVAEHLHKQDSNPQVNQGIKPNKPKHYTSLQHLPMSGSPYSRVENDPRQVMPTRKHIKTPMKPKRCLPQVPADMSDKKKQVPDVTKLRSSASSQSSSSPSSGQCNRAMSSEGRYGYPPNNTPSDKEVSELLDNNQQYSNMDNNGHMTIAVTNHQILPPEIYSQPAIDSVSNTNKVHFTQSTQNLVSSTGGRLSESGQTTLTSQSTIDSGYATNDPEQETIPTSIYAKSLKQSAQSLYSANKFLKPSKGEHPQGHIKSDHQYVNTMNGNFNNIPNRQSFNDHTDGNITQEHFNAKHEKTVHTQNWVSRHQDHRVSDVKEQMYVTKNRHTNHYQSTGNLSMYSNAKQTKMDNNNNSRNSQSHLQVNSMIASYPQDYGHDLSKTGTYPPKRQTISHPPSELVGKDVERRNTESSRMNAKVKSLSMSHGLNLIDTSKDISQGQSLLKTHPKFTGSLKDLIGAGKQIVPVEILKKEDFHQSTGTLFTDSCLHPETSLKSLGKPSLFQVLQNYNLYTVRMKIPEHLKIMENIRMIECEVVLPSSYIFGGETPMSPKGNYAKIGGPNSAFRPVVSGVTSVKTVSMVTVLDISSELRQTFHSGEIKKGDLIVELNEQLMIGEELSTLTSILQPYRGEVILTIARDKARETQQARERNNSSPTDADFRLMEQKIVELTKTLQKRDRTIQKLNTFLPWQSPSVKGQNSVNNMEPIISNLSEDEYIV